MHTLSVSPQTTLMTLEITDSSVASRIKSLLKLVDGVKRITVKKVPSELELSLEDVRKGNIVEAGSVQDVMNYLRSWSIQYNCPAASKNSISFAWSVDLMTRNWKRYLTSFPRQVLYRPNTNHISWVTTTKVRGSATYNPTGFWFGNRMIQNWFYFLLQQELIQTFLTKRGDRSIQ